MEPENGFLLFFVWIFSQWNYQPIKNIFPSIYWFLSLVNTFVNSGRMEQSILLSLFFSFSLSHKKEKKQNWGRKAK